MTRRTQVSFTVTILAAFALVFLVAVGAVVAGYREAGGRAALVTAEQSLRQAAETAAASTRALIRPVVALAAVLPDFAPLLEGSDPAARDTAALLALLGAEPAVQAVSVALPDGTLRQVLRADTLAGAKVPSGAAFALREAGPAAATERWSFLDPALRPLETPLQPARTADARRLQWVLQASDAAVHVSTLYDLPLLGRPGLSVSRRVPGSDAVLGLDMTLDQLAGFLARQRTSSGSVLFLFTEDGILLAHQRPELAVVTFPDGRTSWTTLQSAADPVLRLVSEEYAQGALRPGQTRRLAGPEEPLLVHLAPVENLTAPRVLVAVVAPVRDFTGAVDAAVRDGTVRAGLALAAGLFAIGLLAWRMARPLAALTNEAEAIRRLDFGGAVPAGSRITEIARLTDAMAGMKSALRLFGSYVPRDLVGKLMQEGAAARIGGERRRITVLFTDVESFTTLAEGIDPEALMQIASAYFEAMTIALLGSNATIDKYIGDSVMAIWNAPSDDGLHPRNACDGALRARLVSEQLRANFAGRGWPPLRTRFGLHTGEAVVGNLGSTDRLSYTAIGSMVNVASRLEGLNKHYGSQILISEATRAAAGAGFVTRPVDLVLPKGARTPLEIHELLGLAVGDEAADAGLRADPVLVGRLPAWRRLVECYRQGDFTEARAAAADAGDPERDPVLAVYVARLAELGTARPADWSPVMRFASK